MNILIACPDTVTLGLLTQALSETGAHIAAATNEQEVVEACRQQSYNVIISLFAHPFLNGSELVGKMRKQGKPHPSICLISWVQHEQRVISLYENEVNQYFTFPINLGKLTAKIKNQLLELQR